MPVLTLEAGYVPPFGGNPNTASENGMKMLAQNGHSDIRVDNVSPVV